MANALIGIALFLVAVVALAGVGYLGWRMATGYSKLQASKKEVKHSHVWSPWGDHEVALYDGPVLVRYAPGQLRTCLDPSCGTEDVRMVGGQTTSGEKDLD